MTEPPRLIPFPEVAEKTGIPLRTLRERSWAREFDHIRIGKERYLTPEQLTSFIESLTVPAKKSDDLASVRDRRQRKRARATTTRRQRQEAAA